MKGIGCASTMRGRIREWSDDLQLFDGRAGPSVCDNERQRGLVRRANVNEMNVQSIDFSDELWQSVQRGLAPAPVVLGRPIPRERLDDGELYPLIWSGFLVRPMCRGDAPAQFDQFRLRNMHAKRTNRIVAGSLF